MHVVLFFDVGMHCVFRFAMQLFSLFFPVVRDTKDEEERKRIRTRMRARARNQHVFKQHIRSLLL